LIAQKQALWGDEGRLPSGFSRNGGLKQWWRGPRCGPKSIIFKGHRRIVLPMPVSRRHTVVILVLALTAGVLAGCSSINDRMGPAIADTLPAWAGGLPKDAPPRKGTPEYDAYIQERERKRLEPASANANASAPATTGLEPVH
jgi:hypothetical protein